MMITTWSHDKNYVCDVEVVKGEGHLFEFSSLCDFMCPQTAWQGV